LRNTLEHAQQQIRVGVRARRDVREQVRDDAEQCDLVGAVALREHAALDSAPSPVKSR
jgi:hypothetical protein